MPKVEVTEEYIHIRIKAPKQYDKKSFRVIQIGPKEKQIKATIGCPKGKFKAGKCQVGTQIQKLIFPTDKWTEKEALEWVKKHPKVKTRKKKKKS